MALPGWRSRRRYILHDELARRRDIDANGRAALEVGVGRVRCGDRVDWRRILDHARKDVCAGVARPERIVRRQRGLGIGGREVNRSAVARDGVAERVLNRDREVEGDIGSHGRRWPNQLEMIGHAGTDQSRRIAEARYTAEAQADCRVLDFDALAARGLKDRGKGTDAVVNVESV